MLCVVCLCLLPCGSTVTLAFDWSIKQLTHNMPSLDKTHDSVCLPTCSLVESRVSIHIQVNTLARVDTLVYINSVSLLLIIICTLIMIYAMGNCE